MVVERLAALPSVGTKSLAGVDTLANLKIVPWDYRGKVAGNFLRPSISVRLESYRPALIVEDSFVCFAAWCYRR